MIATPAESLHLEIDVPPRIPAGEPVPITLRASNAGREPLELHLRGRGVVFDISVAGADGSVVWRRLKGQIVPAILQIRMLAPGESLEAREEWDQRTNTRELVSPGAYTVVGVLLTESPHRHQTPAAALEIVPGER